jgi:16S rRNA (adenine(1408)-N(1))-methyltransferase
MVRGCVTVVRGKQIVHVDGEVLRRDASRSSRVVLDLGAGDGRWIYRFARGHPSWLCIGVDANARQMREVSVRAGRKPQRGGAANAWYICAGVETLPGPLRRLADEIHINFPWGSLLQATLAPDLLVLLRIAQIGKPGATLTARINTSILADPDVSARFRLPPGMEDVAGRLCRGYAAAGIQLVEASVSCGGPRTSWNRRLSAGHPRPVLSLHGIIAASGDATFRFPAEDA